MRPQRRDVAVDGIGSHTGAPRSHADGAMSSDELGEQREGLGVIGGRTHVIGLTPRPKKDAVREGGTEASQPTERSAEARSNIRRGDACGRAEGEGVQRSRLRKRRLSLPHVRRTTVRHRRNAETRT